MILHSDIIPFNNFFNFFCAILVFETRVADLFKNTMQAVIFKNRN